MLDNGGRTLCARLRLNTWVHWHPIQRTFSRPLAAIYSYVSAKTFSVRSLGAELLDQRDDERRFAIGQESSRSAESTVEVTYAGAPPATCSAAPATPPATYAAAPTTSPVAYAVAPPPTYSAAPAAPPVTYAAAPTTSPEARDVANLEQYLANLEQLLADLRAQANDAQIKEQEAFQRARDEAKRRMEEQNARHRAEREDAMRRADEATRRRIERRNQATCRRLDSHWRAMGEKLDGESLAASSEASISPWGSPRVRRKILQSPDVPQPEVDASALKMTITELSAPALPQRTSPQAVSFDYIAVDSLSHVQGHSSDHFKTEAAVQQACDADALCVGYYLRWTGEYRRLLKGATSATKGGGFVLIKEKVARAEAECVPLAASNGELAQEPVSCEVAPVYAS